MIPTERELTRCTWPDDGCGRKILWTVTANGERQPLDAKPNQAGILAAYRVGPRSWRSRSLQGVDALPLAPYETRYTAHHQTCPKVRRPAPPPEPTPEIPGLLPVASVTSIDQARRRRAARGR